MSQILYGPLKDDSILGLSDKKRKGKDPKDAKKNNASCPASDRVPLPPLPESVLNERRPQAKDSNKKVKIGVDAPPSVCLYTIINGIGGVCSASLSENCELLAVGYGSSTIQVHPLNQRPIPILKSSSELEQLEMDGESDVHEEMYKPGDLEPIEFTGHSGPVYSLSYSPDRRLLLSGSRDETVRLWSLEMRRNMMVYRMDAPVLRSVYCNRGLYFAASTASKLVSLYSTERIHPLRIFSDAKDDVTALDFHPNCNYIVGGSDDNDVYVWDALTGGCVRKFSGHKTPVHTVKTSPDGRYVLSVSTDGLLNVWDLSSYKLLCSQECSPMPYHVPIVFSKDANIFAMGTPEFGMSIFNFDVATSYGNDYANDQKHNPDGFNMFTYHTKRTTLLDFHFSRRNVIVGVGCFEQ